MIANLIIIISLVCGNPSAVTIRDNGETVWHGSYKEAMSNPRNVKKFKRLLDSGEAILVVRETMKGKCI